MRPEHINYEVIRLTIDNYSQKEIADILGISKDVVMRIQHHNIHSKFSPKKQLQVKISKLERKIFKKARLIFKMERDGFCAIHEKVKLNDLYTTMKQKTVEFNNQ